MPTPLLLLEHFGGIARGVQLAPFGCTRRNLSDAVRRGEVLRLRPGVFAAPASAPGLRAAALHGGALTCASALRMHGVWVLEDDTVPHVWLGAAGRTHTHVSCRCVEHFRPGTMQLGLAPVELALVHSFRCHGEEFFFAAYESAWRQRLIGRVARSRIRSALPASARWLVDLAREDADSGLESIVRLRLYLLGIVVQTQTTIADVGRVDFVLEGRVILEIDGRENHDGPSQRHRDLCGTPERPAEATRHSASTTRWSCTDGRRC
ncbi:type IV toxin-antitoxin system AbiEi family antitoxin domain-containing protein [Microbacterium aurugineum]|uniref:type IV toxin-antitoxin system AbiEi family antitoxin domain-containing protein n=1 Tax=Microbacterium aurugineum TaxID=2851642 RepID=UPI0020C01560|nr:type IV toxin-antitoxin system AbiEi family antitoxin domain-containing protein [Microbacterium aurugineum]MCK8476595.1 type IV toxin-antitoxin system AbiEi family antitoxin domain-containing protein [Microbacterium aurugineum]